MITIEQIDEFRKRTNSSYEDAKYFLEKNNGDILEAIIDFERTKAAKFHNHRKYYRKDFGQSFADALQKGFDTRIVVEDNNSVLFSIPLILLFFLIPLWVVMLLFFVFLYILGYKFSIRDIKSQNINVNAFFQTIGDKMKEHSAHSNQGGNNNMGTYNTQKDVATYTPQNPAAPEAGDNTNGQDKDNEDGFKEYTIE